MKCRDVYISVTINAGKEGKRMVDSVEARGRKSLCALVDLQDYDAACRRYEELGIKIRYDKNKPIVNVEEVRIASRRWFLRKKRG